MSKGKGVDDDTGSSYTRLQEENMTEDEIEQLVKNRADSVVNQRMHQILNLIILNFPNVTMECGTNGLLNDPHMQDDAWAEVICAAVEQAGQAYALEMIEGNANVFSSH